MTFLLLALLGAMVGVFGTLVGAGGGFILTPILLLLYPQDSPETITAITLAVVFFNAASGSVAYAHLRRIDYRSGVAFALTTVPGAVIGSLLVAVAPRQWFAAIMAALLAGIATWLLVAPSTRQSQQENSLSHNRVLTDATGRTYRYTVPIRRGVFFSLGVGFVSSFLGIGGGIIHVPLLVQALGFPIHVATATSHFVLSITAATGTVTHIIAGSFHDAGVSRTVALSLGVVAGAQVGARLSQRVHGHIIQRLLASALIVLAVRLALSAV